MTLDRDTAQELFQATRKIRNVKQLTYLWNTGEPDRPGEYAIIGTEEDYPTRLRDLVFQLNASRLAGFNIGDLCFVLSVNIPRREFIEHIARHELIESCYTWAAAQNRPGCEQYARAYPHGNACTFQLPSVFKQGETFTEEFAKWTVDSNKDWPDDNSSYFHQAIPEFLQKNKPGVLDPTTILVRFWYEVSKRFAMLDNSQYHEAKRKLPWIEKHFPSEEYQADT